MIVDWHPDTEQELIDLASKGTSHSVQLNDMWEMFNEFGKSGLSRKNVTCSSVCYWPDDITLKGFFCFDGIFLHVLHIVETINDQQLNAALKIAEQRCPCL